MIIDAILNKAFAGCELTAEEGASLFAAEGQDFERLLYVADQLCRRRVGNGVSYVINRNINFTNVCVKRCGFCAFSRGGLPPAVGGDPTTCARGQGTGCDGSLHASGASA